MKNPVRALVAGAALLGLGTLFLAAPPLDAQAPALGDVQKAVDAASASPS
jgi:hypothetical protein